MPQNLLLARKAVLAVPVAAFPETLVLALSRPDVRRGDMVGEIGARLEDAPAVLPGAGVRGPAVVLRVGLIARRGRRRAGRGCGRRQARTGHGEFFSRECIAPGRARH